VFKSINRSLPSKGLSNVSIKDVCSQEGGFVQCGHPHFLIYLVECPGTRVWWCLIFRWWYKIFKFISTKWSPTRALTYAGIRKREPTKINMGNLRGEASGREKPWWFEDRQSGS